MAQRLPQSMKDAEYALIGELLAKHGPQDTLEVGMANGGSTEVFCNHHKAKGSGIHVAIDPFQSAEEGSKGFGLQRINELGLKGWLEFYEDFDYIVLPQLVKAKRRFDFVLIDGWHSFDYTLVDFFFVDLLLKPNGLVLLHDTELPSVNRACRFIETHKPYERVSPPLYLKSDSTLERGINKVKRSLSNAEERALHKDRATKWHSLSAYRKKEDHLVSNTFYKDF